MRKWGYLVPLTIPAMLLGGIALGGMWTWLPVLFVFGLVPIMDLLVGRDTWNPAPEQVASLEKEAFYRIILYAWVPVQFVTLATVVSIVARYEMSMIELAGVVVSTGTMTGAIGITIAHELGHKLNTREQWLGKLLLMSVCYAHFHVEHNKGHHARVATPSDPATARYGQSIFSFLPQTLVGSFRSAWRFERERLARVHLSVWRPKNQVLVGLLGSLAIAVTIAVWGGMTGLTVFLAQAGVAILLLEIVNYVEHYGLERSVRPGGGYSKVEPCHSWNASERFTNWFLFNLQRHSHHHVEHHRRYQVLKHMDESPQLPTGYAGMVLLALVPPLWTAVIHPQLERWQKRGEQA